MGELEVRLATKRSGMTEVRKGLNLKKAASFALCSASPAAERRHRFV
jgi:hypothetical protein